ncbi:hypothetical protein WMY93_017258 [Mugilogobius chulae]|uniref:Ig-like domain-containing protein n=1 Tax=Mugilogobius chulae TaxID=88201 RepID=A0AAW0NN61_9GOBI
MSTIQSQRSILNYIFPLLTSLQNLELTPAVRAMLFLLSVSAGLLWTLCSSQLRFVQQKECFKMAKLGETVEIKCLTQSIWEKRVWYKLGINKSLHLITSTNNLFQQNSPVDPRYSVKSSTSETSLTILHMTKEDVATYYCGIVNSQDVLFGSGTVLELEGDSKPVQTELQSPDYIRVQPGDSVTLTCSFNTSFCSEQTSVTWIKSGLTTEIIAQSSGIKNIVCGNTDGTSCVHNLTLKDVNSAEDGTYFCVVSACGHSLTGTRIRVNGSALSEQSDCSSTVLILTGLNVVFAAAVVVLVWVVYSSRKNQQTEVDCSDSTRGEQTEDEVTYAGVNVVSRSATNSVSALLLWTLCASQQHHIEQKECFKKAKLRETVVMKCQTESVWPNRVWYKLGTNKNLHLIASTNKVFQQNPTFDPRYSVKSSASETTLTILHMTKEDVGTYYCGIVNPDDIFFGSGTVLELEGDSKPVQTELQSPDYIRVQPGGSVTLTCSFNTNACSEQTSVTWIKSGWTTEIITQSSGIKNIVCGNTDGTSCVHNLTLKDVSSAEDGTYFCVVSACGHSLTGTRIQVNGASQQHHIEQKECFKTAKLGETVEMKCQTESVWENRVWYKLGTNKNLYLIASTNILFQQNSPLDPHYSVKSSPSETTLTILQMTKDDVGTYYCGIVFLDNVLFGSGTVLELEGDSKPVQTELQSPDYIRVQPGDSVTLTCSSLCSEQTSVTWIKSGLTTEIIAQSSGIKNIVCGNTDGTSCVHNLTLKDVSSAEDGTYFCVVSACGHSLTGTRIRVNGGGALSEQSDFSPTVLILTVLNVVFAGGCGRPGVGGLQQQEESTNR